MCVCVCVPRCQSVYPPVFLAVAFGRDLLTSQPFSVTQIKEHWAKFKEFDSNGDQSLDFSEVRCLCLGVGVHVHVSVCPCVRNNVPGRTRLDGVLNCSVFSTINAEHLKRFSFEVRSSLLRFSFEVRSSLLRA